MRVLVCGGREYGCIPKGCPLDQRGRYAEIAERERFILRETLNDLWSEVGPFALIEGGATGADAWAEMWYAKKTGNPSIEFKAEWTKYGKRAGPLRNQRMIDEGKPDLVIVFKGGDGTADMVRKARAASVEVREIASTPE